MGSWHDSGSHTASQLLRAQDTFMLLLWENGSSPMVYDRKRSIYPPNCHLQPSGQVSEWKGRSQLRVCELPRGRRHEPAVTLLRLQRKTPISRQQRRFSHLISKPLRAWCFERESHTTGEIDGWLRTASSHCRLSSGAAKPPYSPGPAQAPGVSAIHM